MFRRNVLVARRHVARRFSTSPSAASKPKNLTWPIAAAVLASGGLGFWTAKSLYTKEVDTKSLSAWVDHTYGGEKELEKALPEFVKALGEDGLSREPEILKSHGYSEWSTYNIDETPLAVVYPTSTEEVSQVAKICHKYRLPMIGYSGGSSLEGHFCAPHGGVCVDFSFMDSIIKIRPDDMDCTVQPGVGWMDLNSKLEKYGLFFAVDPGPTAKIGGMVSNNCSGTNCVKYGPMRNHIVNMTVVLADGTIIKTRRRPRKTSAGYNLNHLFAGAEGTLGLITEVTLKLEPIPEKTSVAVCSFPSVRAACAAATDVIKSGVLPHAVELMDDVQMWAVNKAGYTKKKWEEHPTLFFKFSGTEKSVEDQIERAKTVAEKHDSMGFDFAEGEEEQHELWKARKEVLWSMLALGPQNGKIYSTDVCVPMSRLADLVQLAKEDITEAGVFASCLGHVGDSNFHSSYVYKPEEYQTVKSLAEKAIKHGLDLEGTCTGEHGVGAGKVDYLVQELGPETVSVMASIKQALDPLGLMNPGKIFTKESIKKN